MTFSASDLGFRDPVPRHRDRRLAIVHGNCQAESLRLLLDGETLATVRIPPVHELVGDDVPHLHRWLARADAVISQPVRPGYRGLPVGTADVLAAAGPRTRAIIVPVVRYAGLYPELAIVRPPHDPAAAPPIVAYHSLRTLVRAAGGRLPALRAEAVRDVARASRDALRTRERAHATIPISDLFGRPRFSLMRTINHPGNELWLELATRVRAALSIAEPVRDPGRPLLDSVHAPRDPVVLDTFGLDGGGEADWLVEGERVDCETVQDAHLNWYARHPRTVDAGLQRHADTLALLRWR